MKLLCVACLGASLWGQAGPEETMTKINVRLMGPGIRPGSNAALPKLIYRSGTKYARMEQAPEARQRIEKITIISEPDAYSVDLMGHTGTHVVDQGGPGDLHLPMVLPFDPNHKLGILDRLEFGSELDFFNKAGAVRSAGPIINAKPTDQYSLKVDGGHAELITRDKSDVPVFMSWTSKEGTYKYEYGVYQDVPFDAKLFARPAGIKFREIAPATPDEMK